MMRWLTHGFNKAFNQINKLFAGQKARHTVFARAIMAMGVGLLLSTCLVQPLSMTTSAMFSSPENRDFKLTDLFAQIADNRPVRSLDDRIVVLNIGRSEREEIAETLSLLSLCGPKAVGVDINFAHPTDDDSFLLDAISSLPNAVFPLGVSPKKKDGVFTVEDKPFFFDQLKDVNYGVVNLPLSSGKGTVREYAIDFPTEIGTLPSFVTAIAEKVDPKAVESLRMKDSETGVTAYHSREYKILNLDEVEEHAEELADKIILMGALEDAGDMHATPVKSHVAGVLLHAAALSTVLDGVWYQKLPRAYDYLLAISLCFGIMLVVYGFKSNFKGILLRFIQASLAILAVRIGYGLFVDKNILFDISFTITIIAFGLFGVDIWNAMEELWNICSRKLAKLDAKYKSESQLC